MKWKVKAKWFTLISDFFYSLWYIFFTGHILNISAHLVLMQGSRVSRLWYCWWWRVFVCGPSLKRTAKQTRLPRQPHRLWPRGHSRYCLSVYRTQYTYSSRNMSNGFDFEKPILSPQWNRDRDRVPATPWTCNRQTGRQLSNGPPWITKVKK